MKEYRYITFKPNTSESQTELFSEMQYSMKNFDLKDCDELEKYIDFEKSKLVINVCLSELQQGISGKYKRQILNLVLTPEEIEEDVEIPTKYNVRYVNGCKIDEYRKRRNTYINVLNIVKKIGRFERYGKSDIADIVFDSTREPEMEAQLVIKCISAPKQLVQKREKPKIREDLDQFDDYEWIMYHDFANFTQKEIEILTKGKIVQETASRMIIILDGLNEEKIKELIGVCKGKKQLTIKLLPTDVNKLLSMRLKLNRDEYDISYSCNTVAQAPLEVIEQLGINSVLIGAMENVNVQEMQQEKYKQVYRILKGIVKEASGKSDEYTKFITVYKRLAKILAYDNEQVERENEGIYDENEFCNSRNLENGLLKGKCVCVGYAEILKQALSLLDIECQNCSSEVTDDGEAHAYNQVKIDGVWYNTDLTWDSNSIRRHVKPQYCLKSDSDFRRGIKKEEECLHYSADENVRTCNKSYKINKRMLGKSIEKISEKFKTRKRKTVVETGNEQIQLQSKFKQRYMHKVDTSLINVTQNKGEKQSNNREEL